MDLLEAMLNEIDNEIDCEELGLTTYYAVDDSAKGYRIEDDRQADRILRQYNASIAEKNQNEEAAKEAKELYITKVNECLERRNKKPQATIDRCKFLLQEYMLRKYKGEKGTLHLENGSIKYAAQRDEISWNEEQAIEFLKNKKLDQYLKISYSIDKNTLKKEMTKTASGYSYKDEPIPGIEFIPRPMAMTLPDGSKIEYKPESDNDDISVESVQETEKKQAVRKPRKKVSKKEEPETKDESAVTFDSDVSSLDCPF